jgi:hypothetical protein
VVSDANQGVDSLKSNVPARRDPTLDGMGFISPTPDNRAVGKIGLLELGVLISIA